LSAWRLRVLTSEAVKGLHRIVISCMLVMKTFSAAASDSGGLVECRDSLRYLGLSFSVGRGLTLGGVVRVRYRLLREVTLLSAEDSSLLKVTSNLLVRFAQL
jgi:hypothetical protein